MKWIQPYNLYNSINESKSNSSKVVVELCVAMSLLNDKFLYPILDMGNKARYTENSSVFVNDLRNLVFGNNRLRVGEFKGDKFVESNELSITNKYFSELDGFDINKDWNKLIKARNLARDIQDKLLDEKMDESDIKFIYWISPNKKKGDVEELVIETNDGKQYSISLNSKISSSKTKSFNSLSEILFNKGGELFNDDYIKKWDKLTQEWIRIIYENSNKEIQKIVEKFIDPDRIYSMTWGDYFKSKHNDPRYKYLGEYIKQFDKNILNLSDLMSLIFKNSETSFDNPKKVVDEWYDIKRVILNSRILEHLFTESFKSMGSSDKDIKERLMKVSLDLLNIGEREINYFYSDKYYKMPSRSFFRDKFDEFEIKYDYHTELTGENNENDYVLSINLYINDDYLIGIKLSTGWTSTEMSGKLSTKIKFDIPDNYNFIIYENLNRN